MKPRILVLILITIFCFGCATQKAYTGEALPKEELAIIYNSETTEFDDGEIISLIETVGDMQVGDSWNGWPSKIEVRPGEVLIGLRFREVSFFKNLSKGLLAGVGGAVGGAIAGATDSESEGIFFLKANTVKGTSYKIKIISDSNSVKDVKVILGEYISD